MNRILTTVALSCWIGYFAVSAFSSAILASGHAAPDLGSPGIFIRTLDLAIGGADLVTPLAGYGLFAAAASAVAGSLAMALVRLHSVSPPVLAAGERLARRALLGTAALLALITLWLLRHEGSFAEVLGPWLALIFSFGALVFDHAFAETAEPQDDAGFEQAIATLASGMALQTRLYTPVTRDLETENHP